MKTEEIIELFRQFESIANEYEGIECWSAREMKAKEACLNTGENPKNHFPHVGKMIELGSGAQREISY